MSTVCNNSLAANHYTVRSIKQTVFTAKNTKTCVFAVNPHISPETHHLSNCKYSLILRKMSNKD